LENKETVCAVVVTYNRKDLLIECLDAIKGQTRPVDAIYVIDNFSSDGTPDKLLENEYILELPPKELNAIYEKECEIKNSINNEAMKIFYVRMNENTGGAGGFYEGVKRGYEKGYDWLWLMDDDAEPQNACLEKMLKYKDIDEDIICVASRLLTKDKKIVINHRGYFNFSNMLKSVVIPAIEDDYLDKSTFYIDFISFVGPLIKSKIIGIVGFPKKEFFIHHDDVEYCIRLKQFGKILLVTDSIIVHKEAAHVGNRIIKTLLWKTSARTSYEKFWINYYGIRNIVWLGNKYNKNKAVFYIEVFKNFFHASLGILLFDDHKIRRIKFIINAYLDGLKGKFENDKPKKYLYEYNTKYEKMDL
jgi:GT2 family glycosyltransferase